MSSTGLPNSLMFSYLSLFAGSYCSSDMGNRSGSLPMYLALNHVVHKHEIGLFNHDLMIETACLRLKILNSIHSGRKERA